MHAPAAPDVGPQGLLIEDLNDQVLQKVLELLPIEEMLYVAPAVNRRWHRVVQQLCTLCLPPGLQQAAAEPAEAGSGSSSSARRTLSPTVLFARCCFANLLTNPELNQGRQLEQRSTFGGDVHARGITPWRAIPGGHHWRWGAEASEGMTLPGQLGPPPLPPPPLRAYQAPSHPIRQAAQGLLASLTALFGGGGSNGGGRAAPPPVQTGVVASSWLMASLLQVVDLEAELQARGLTQAAAEAFLATYPAIELTVAVAGRFDCGSLFCASLALLSTPAAELNQSINNVYNRVPGARFFEGLQVVASTSTGQQPTEGPTWVHQRLLLSGYGTTPGAKRQAPPRSAMVVLSGRDMQQWQGHYGAKFASPSLRFLPAGADAGGATYLGESA